MILLQESAVERRPSRVVEGVHEAIHRSFRLAVNEHVVFDDGQDRDLGLFDGGGRRDEHEEARDRERERGSPQDGRRCCRHAGGREVPSDLTRASTDRKRSTDERERLSEEDDAVSTTADVTLPTSRR